MPRKKKTLTEEYKATLIQLMTFKNGVQYQKDDEFSPTTLGTVTPTDIVRWMCLKVYGKPDPNDDDFPTEGRSNSLNYYKKALSHFMPNRLMHWNELANPPVGNPTKSAPVNDLIRKVKKMEVRKQGKPSCARRAFLESEYEAALAKLKATENVEVRLFASTIFVFQFCMIARIDDSSKLRHDSIKCNHQHPDYSVLARLCWSKNVHEERDAPDQILMGAMDPSYCVILGLATWLEYAIGCGHFANTEFAFGIFGEKDPIAIKEKASALMKGILNDETFALILEGLRGTHSTRKLATSRARKNGCSKDDVDTRARWKRKRQQDVYADTLLPYPDAKVAAALCKGGAIHYKVKVNSGISEDWILTHVVPLIATKYSRSVAVVLGRALLWRVFDEKESCVVPEYISQRVRNAYRDLRDR